MYIIPIIALLVVIIIAFKLPIFKPKDVPIVRLESDDDHDFGDVVKHVAPPKPPMEVHTMFDVGDDAGKSHPLPYDTTGLTYDYWGVIFMDRVIAYIVLFLAGVIAGATLEKYADGMCRK